MLFMLQFSEGKNGKWKKTGLCLKEHITDVGEDLSYPAVEKIMVHLEEIVFSVLTCLAQN